MFFDVDRDACFYDLARILHCQWFRAGLGLNVDGLVCACNQEVHDVQVRYVFAC